MKTITHNGVSIDYRYVFMNGVRVGYALETYSPTGAQSYTNMASYAKCGELMMDEMKVDGAKYFFFKGRNASIAYAALVQNKYPFRVFYEGQEINPNRLRVVKSMVERKMNGNVLHCAQLLGGSLDKEILILFQLYPTAPCPLAFLIWDNKGNCTVESDPPKHNRYRLVFDFAPGDHLRYDIKRNKDGSIFSAKKPQNQTKDG